MTVRSTAGFGLLRYDPGNPEFPTLPDGVIVPHLITFGGASTYTSRLALRTKSVVSAIPSPDAARFAGWQSDTTWVNPSVIDFGVIPSPVRREVSLYNARFTSIEVTALSLPTGVTLVGPALPLTLDPYTGTTFTLEANTTGDNSFDLNVAFTTSEGDVTFRILGRRVFTINVLPETPIQETLFWRTDLIRSTDGSEKAYSLMTAPMALVKYGVRWRNDLQRIRFRNDFVAGESALVVAGQKWYEARRLNSAITTTDTFIPVDTVNTSFYVGQPISVVTEDGLSVASGQIDSFSSPEGTGFTLGAQVGINAPAGSFVMPVGLGYVADFPVYGTHAKNLEDVTYGLMFNQETNDPNLSGIFPTLTDLQSPETTLPVLEFNNEIGTRSKPTSLIRAEDKLDSGLTNRLAFSELPFADEISEFRITLTDPADVWTWRQFFHYLRGSYGEFYVPTFTDDIPGVTTAASNVFNIDDIDLSLLFGNPPDPRRNALRMVYPNGNLYYRMITQVIDNGATEQVTVSSAVEAGNPYISFLQRCRIHGDTVTFEHRRNDDVTVTFRYRTVLL